MEEWQRELITRNLPELIKCTNCDVTLLSRFESSLILGRADIEKLNVPGLTRSQQTREFYNIIVNRKNSFETLLKALEKNCQSGALAILNVESYFDDTQISYYTDSELGKGSYGTIVYKGEIGDRIVAVKVVHINFLGRVQVFHEIKMLKDCDAHENVIRYFGAKRIDTSILIALELCDLSLKDWVEKKYNDIPPVEVLRQVTVGLEWLHSKKIVHRDIKPENVLFIQQIKKVKLSDFGLSRRILDGNSFVATANVGGTSGWMAPEILAHREQESQTQCKFTYASDVFSLGCVYYYVLSDGKYSFGNPVTITCQYNILKGKSMIEAKEIQHGCSQNTLFIDLMILRNPKSRPTCTKILSYPIFWSLNRRVRFLEKLVTQIGSGMDKISSYTTQDPCRFDHSAEIRVLRGLGRPANQGIGCVIPFASTHYTSKQVDSFEVKADNCETLESTRKQEIAPGSINNLAKSNIPAALLKLKTEQLIKIEPVNPINSEADNTSNLKTIWSDQNQAKINTELNELKQLNLEEKNARLLEIVKKEDFSIIKGVLEGVESELKIIDVWDEKQKSLLHVAVSRGDYDVVEYLFNNAFEKVISELMFEHTLVHDCIKDIHETRLHLQNADAFTQKCRILELLFRKRPQLIESRGDYNYHCQCTPLHVATAREFINEKRVELIEMLLRHNPNVNAKESVTGGTPLHLLFSRNEPTNAVETMRLLITHNAHPDALNKYGLTFLHLAAQYASPSLFHEVVVYLVSIHKINSFTIPSKSGWTVLHYAVHHMKDGPLSKTLEIFNAHRVDFNALDRKGDSVMFHAIQHQRSEDFLRLLIQFGADWTITNENQETVLHEAAYHENLVALKLFISLEADVNAKDKYGNTPLHKALSERLFHSVNHDVVKELVNNGADPTLKNRFRESPIYRAKQQLKEGEVEQRTVQLLENVSKFPAN